MFINLMLILIIFNNMSDSEILMFNNQSKHEYYSKLLSNFPVNESELNAINRLIGISNDIDNYNKHLERHHISGKSLVSSVTNILKNILRVIRFKNFFKALKKGFSTAAECLGCNIFMNLIVNRLIGFKTIKHALLEVCSAFRITTPTVCRGFVDQFENQIDYIRSNTKLTANEICGVLFGVQCSVGESEYLFWKIDIPKKLDISWKSKLNKTSKKSDSQKIYQIMQITDIHLDSIYSTGSESDCGEPLCCRKNNKITDIKSFSGKWGSYPCDVPLDTVLNALTEIARNARFADLWYWTGDVVPHDFWLYNRNSSLMYSKIITQYLEKFTKTVVIPAIGNHESVPLNSFSPPSIKNKLSNSWLYDELANLWSKWLPKKALETIRYGGFYSLSIRPGFRVIVLNTNYCARLNFWSLYDPKDPADHLKWLIKELLIAEQVGDSVHIVAHIPPDNRECTQAWIYNFLAVVERFKDTIVAQFYGHTHADEFRVFFSNNNISNPIGYGFIGPSLTTYRDFNPGYRIYTTDQKGIITDVDTFYFNLKQANQVSGSDSEPEFPIWSHEYSMAKSYSMTDFSHIGFNGILNELMKNDYVLRKYRSFYWRLNDLLTTTFCDNQCKHKLISDIIIGNPYEKNPKSILSRG